MRTGRFDVQIDDQALDPLNPLRCGLGVLFLGVIIDMAAESHHAIADFDPNCCRVDRRLKLKLGRDVVLQL